MQTLRVIIYVFLASILAGAHAREASPDAGLVRIQAASAELCEKYRQTSDDETSAVRKKFAPLDQQLAERLRHLIHQHAGFENVLKAASGVLNMREWPHDIDYQTRSRFQYESDPSLQVNYRRTQLADGVELYFVSHSYDAGSDRRRITPSMYLIVKRDGKAVIQPLPDLGPDELLVWDQAAPVFLGFLPGTNGWPSIALMEGPHGSGSKTHLVLYCHDEAISRWKRRVVGEWWESGQFEYTEATATLTISVSVYDMASKEPVRRELTYTLRPELCQEGNELTPVG